MTSLTDIIADIRKAMERATPGPWAVEDEKFCGDYSVAWKPELKVCRTYGDSLSAECDAAYIAACNPSNIAAVLDALEMAEVERDQLRKDLNTTNAALALQGYGVDTHAAIVGAAHKAISNSKENRLRAETAEAALKEAVELLKPFAYAKDFSTNELYEDGEAVGIWLERHAHPDCTVGDIRAAARFIDARTTGGDDAFR
jgi:hypothetical protein